ncbi:hypothetical protein BDP81DRAFT_379963 [Colletotrichum phormii]|uniref:Uncharacterized protein n=1 Tax=Colletotrichum phormii TaxID=359342 RepID=A0AAJ0EBI1_9PEZI|nr:uncharacterized protein BDP81DRAFT_379963 [Colletotrichum phormii]KAK1633667.1 hypothetical protein BDP81DRAFT_379963 [Colletotrichum phormii]
MFRLATAPTRSSGVSRHLLAGLATPPSPAWAPAAPSPTTTRTVKTKSKLRPLPGLKKTGTSKPSPPKPRDIVFEPRSLTEFKIRLREISYMHVTAERAHDIYMKYMQALARSDKPTDWQKAFVRENNITAGELHETAGLLSWMHDNKGEAELILRCSMMETAAGLGYDAAALTLSRILHHAEGSKGYYDWDNPRWQHTRTRCLALIAEGRDANAMVVAGLRHLRRKTERDDYLALEAFSQALELGKDAAYFDWRCTALEGQGDAYLRLGEKEKAKESFVHLGQLGYAVGWSRLAQMYPDDPGVLHWLLQAAGAGISSAYGQLVELGEKRRKLCAEAVGEAGHKEAADSWERHAAEWTRILKASIANEKSRRT